MPIASLDTESFYSGDVSITTLGIYHYLRHPEQEIYMVSIATDTGIRYAGHPKDFDWTQIAGPDWVWLSHNAQFDLPVFERLQELGVGNTRMVTELEAWHDTADLTAFLGYPRSLKAASEHLLGQQISKETRDQMKGKRWETMSPEFKQEVIDYAIKDAVNCLDLWLQHGHKWPEEERQISAMTRNMALRGVPLDVEGLDRDINKLEADIWSLIQSIPWKDEPHSDASKAKKGEKRPLLSPTAFRDECAKLGIEAPASLAQGNEEAEQFFETYGEKYPWIRAVGNYRKANKHLATLKTMRARVQPNGWMTYGLKYFGAHTGRDSGESGINLQNIPKGRVSGVDIRAKIKAPDGYTLVVCDLSQIEPRCLHWLADDTTTLDYIRRIPDLYEAQARAWGIWDGEGSMKKVAPDVRHTMKQLALGLGYGMGAKRFADVADVSDAEAVRLTKLYRAKNPDVLKLWKKLEAPMAQTARDPVNKDCSIHLPSGRAMRYKRVAVRNDGLTAEIPKGRALMRVPYWGGILCENVVQATARDVFMHQCLKIEEAGIPVIMRVHDEAVCLVKESEAEARLAQIIQIMSTAPSWAPGLPLAAEGGLTKVYTKG